MERAEPLTPNSEYTSVDDPRPPRRTKTNVLLPIVIVIALAILAVLVWRFLLPNAELPGTPPAQPAATAPPPAAPAPPAAEATPKYPIAQAAVPTPAATPPLPSVADSDATLQDAMASLFNGVALDRIFHLQEIVPRFVATIDNLPRQSVALSKMSTNPVPGSLEVSRSDGKTLLRADNAERYTPYVRVLEQTDPQKLVETYVRYYPLFQKSYQDLGYPNGYFNDRVVQVIDHLLAAPDVPAPIPLAQPKVLYEFADPALEQLSAGQKMMIRMGPVNESHVKAKLRQIRKALTGQTLPK
jgi:hypothetical protein